MRGAKPTTVVKDEYAFPSPFDKKLDDLADEMARRFVYGQGVTQVFQNNKVSGFAHQWNTKQEEKKRMKPLTYHEILEGIMSMALDNEKLMEEAHRVIRNDNSARAVNNALKMQRTVDEMWKIFSAHIDFAKLNDFLPKHLKLHGVSFQGLLCIFVLENSEAKTVKQYSMKLMDFIGLIADSEASRLNEALPKKQKTKRVPIGIITNTLGMEDLPYSMAGIYDRESLNTDRPEGKTAKQFQGLSKSVQEVKGEGMVFASQVSKKRRYKKFPIKFGY